MNNPVFCRIRPFVLPSRLLLWALAVLAGLMQAGLVSAGSPSAAGQPLTISMTVAPQVLEPAGIATLTITVANGGTVPVAFKKPGCYKGDHFVVSFDRVQARSHGKSPEFSKIEMSGGVGNHSVKEGVFTGSVELIEPGQALVFPMAVYLTGDRRLLVEGHESFGSTGYFPGIKEADRDIPARFAGCGRSYELESSGTCRIFYHYVTEEHDRTIWRSTGGGDEHFPKLWIGTCDSEAVELQIR